MPIEVVRQKIEGEDLKRFIGNPFSDMIKFVVDVRNGVMALGGELHADAEALLLEQGSRQADLWGGNYYPDRPGEKSIDFTSLINIRPSARNPSLEVLDEKIRSSIRRTVGNLLP